MFKRNPTAVPDPTSFIVPYQLDVEVIRLDGDDLLLRWRETAVTIHIYYSKNPNPIDTFCKTISETNETIISGLDANQRYYFRLQFEGGIWHGRTLIVAERVLPVGVVNFRDIGGYETEDGRFTKWGCVYRSGALLDLSQQAIDRLQQLAITAVCDLRSEEEITKHPDYQLEGAFYQQLSVLDLARWTKWRGLFAVLFSREKLHDFMIEGYTKVMVDDNPQIVRHIFETVADTHNLPTLIHCTAGKDRSGVAIALLLHSLGVPNETILADYTFSNHYYAEFKKLIEPDIVELRRVGIYADDLHAVLILRRTMLEATFAHIDERYGSFATYLKDHVGIDDTMMAAIRRNLLI